jgi:hypothetical protein
MSNPYPSTELRSLTDNGIAHYRKLNERDQTEMDTLRRVRAEHEAEIASIDDVMKDLQDTIARRAAKSRGDIISLLPQPEPVPTSVFTPQGDPFQHQDAFGGPQTGTFLGLLCPCGDPMELDPKHGPVHLVDGGWEVAGEFCKRHKDATRVLPAIDAEPSP